MGAGESGKSAGDLGLSVSIPGDDDLGACFGLSTDGSASAASLLDGVSGLPSCPVPPPRELIFDSEIPAEEDATIVLRGEEMVSSITETTQQWSSLFVSEKRLQ